ncbi:hypothetical protein [Pelagerythrobacter aerophilus]|uniref:Uncharacterized protein n=1 Tax=Pelagerythrobacter aerophilus TaxID=2306995 RepID=A0A418NJV2_9SPHN|nr:hypothetical protein [Pelagerythrobacter aerophilus]RIV79573.1 hypothetical protein D2V04_06275 [Pelagerythrobacter aerophilus]
MGLLDGGVTAIFGAAFGGFYLDATLHAGTGEPIYDPVTGAVIGYTGGDTACKAQVDAATDAMRRADGYAEGDARIIVLAQGLPAITSDNEITVREKRWRLLSAELDAAASHWVCRARAV